MKLYHGSILAVETPQIVRTLIGRDFGFAFYTTDIQTQAEKWALRRQLFAREGGNPSACAIVSVYDFDAEAAHKMLQIKDFPVASMAWLDFVLQCRSQKDFAHGYDLVTGKIANDNVGETVAYVSAGIMRKEDAIERLRFQRINNQIAFCTPQALSFLQFESSYEVKA